ncbi:hypothetical protein SS37A_20170 [Methylocystis iwaonis]|uniref:Uncharacterized protein n=1 Tax=Methylocystis iwaonis TaxID=2885079 RepID=A0ABN6VFP1_9HYPH|nr:hypothetical protein SS37A_20170 [Methylocystis iwaonis]
MALLRLGKVRANKDRSRDALGSDALILSRYRPNGAGASRLPGSLASETAAGNLALGSSAEAFGKLNRPPPLIPPRHSVGGGRKAAPLGITGKQR